MKFKKIILALSLIGIAPCLMNVSEPQEETTITMEDKDNNGIPDTIEDYYNEHIRDQYAFGIGLGSIIGIASSIVGVVVMVVVSIHDRDHQSHAVTLAGSDQSVAG